MKLKLAAIVFVFCLSITFVQGAQTSLDIYSNGQTQVSQRFSKSLSVGQQSVTVENVSDQLIPSSVQLQFLSGQNFTILSQNFYPSLRADTLLTKLLGKSVQGSLQSGQVFEGILLNAASDLLIQQKNSKLLFVPRSALQSLEFTEDNSTKSPALVWQIQNRKAQELELNLSYLTSGLSWQAHYSAILNEAENELELSCQIEFNNQSGTNFKDAQVSFVAGEIGGGASPSLFRVRSMAILSDSSQAIQESSVFEYHRYKFTRPVTLENLEQKLVPFFNAEKIAVTKSYRYDAQTDAQKVFVNFEQFEIKKRELALPAGALQVYKQDSSKKLFLIAQSSLPNLPILKKIDFQTSSAFDLQASRSVLESQALGKRGQTQKIKVNLTNSKSEDVIIEVVEHFGSFWKVTESNISAQKKDAQSAVFNVPVTAQSSATLEYTVETRW